MSTVELLVVGFAAALSLISLGGGLYEFSVVDPYWPTKPELIQPQRGGINRKYFWIPAHIAFEVALIGSLILAWRIPAVRYCLLMALASHAAMRIWSGLDFIPKALAFERASAESFSLEAARSWTKRSLLRLPLDLLTCTAMLAALVVIAGPASTEGADQHGRSAELIHVQGD